MRSIKQAAEEEHRSRAFQWNPRYSVKITAMDNQHRKLFELVNQLSQAMDAGRGEDVIGKTLLSLVDYTQYHFLAEEKLMERYKFAGLPTHRGEHNYLTERVQAFKKDFDAGNRDVTSELLAFLQKWLTNHIQVVDQRYSDFLNAQGVH